MRKGTIYVITNKVNGKQYVGQTSRDIEIRFNEHCCSSKGHSKINSAIQKYGWRNFDIKPLEVVPLDELDIKERFWIKELRTQENGYNVAPGGKDKICIDYPKIRVVENDLLFNSKEEMSQIFSKITSWSVRFLSNKFKRVIENNEEFLGYHFKQEYTEEFPSDYDILEDWIKTLNIKYTGKHIYCIELEKEFETIASAAQYLLNNNLYITKSKTPIQSLVTSIGKNIHGKSESINGINSQYTFEEVPGTTKQSTETNLWTKTKVYCEQLDKTFESQADAAKYLIDNQIWTGIKLKTAKLRISDVVRGAFPDYRGYTFKYVE